MADGGVGRAMSGSLFATSDLHVSYAENGKVVDRLRPLMDGTRLDGSPASTELRRRCLVAAGLVPRAVTVTGTA